MFEKKQKTKQQLSSMLAEFFFSFLFSFPAIECVCFLHVSVTSDLLKGPLLIQVNLPLK